MIDGGHIQEQAAARALSALPPEESAQVDRHVGTCTECKQVLDEAVETANMIALSVAPAAPPSRCKQRLMARVEQEQFLRRPSRTLPRSAMWAGRAATMVMLIGLLGWNVRLQSEVREGRTVQSIIGADAQPRPLKAGHPSAGAAKARMFMDPGGTTAVLLIENLQPLPDDKVYQIWVADEQRQQPMETFRVGHKLEQIVMRAHEPLTHFKWVMVTIESGGGSEKPTGDTVLFGDL